MTLSYSYTRTGGLIVLISTLCLRLFIVCALLKFVVSTSWSSRHRVQRMQSKWMVNRSRKWNMLLQMKRIVFCCLHLFGIGMLQVSWATYFSSKLFKFVLKISWGECWTVFVRYDPCGVCSSFVLHAACHRGDGWCDWSVRHFDFHDLS